MKRIQSLEEMTDHVRGRESLTLAVAAGHDPATIEAAARASREGICKVTLVADPEKVEALCREKGIERDLFHVEEERDETKAARKAVEMVHAGEAQVLMKGLLGTEKYMRAILDKEKGLLPRGALLTHLAVMEVPALPRLLFVSDVAVIPAPDLEQKVRILAYAIQAARKFGIERPRAAVLAATEKVSPAMPATLDGAVLAQMARRGQIGDAEVDGPLALDVALSEEAAAVKGLESPVAGKADILLFPTIEAGNIFYKAVTKLAGGRLGAVVAGAAAPCVLTSRADDEETKFFSIVLGCLLG